MIEKLVRIITLFRVSLIKLGKLDFTGLRNLFSPKKKINIKLKFGPLALSEIFSLRKYICWS